MVLPIRARLRLPHSQSLPSGSFHNPLILVHQRADRMKTTITENQPNWSHGSQPYLIQWNYEPWCIGPHKTDRSLWCVLTKLEKGVASHFCIIALSNPWTIQKGKQIWHWKMNSQLGFSSVQFSHSVVSDSLRPHGQQHARLPCPTSTPGAYPNSRPLSWWCHPTMSSSVIPFSFCLQSFPAWGSFPISQFFTSGGQSIGVSASTSVPPMNTQDWSPLEWTGWISLMSKGLSRVFSNTIVQKHKFFCAQLSL